MAVPAILLLILCVPIQQNRDRKQLRLSYCIAHLFVYFEGHFLVWILRFEQLHEDLLVALLEVVVEIEWEAGRLLALPMAKEILDVHHVALAPTHFVRCGVLSRRRLRRANSSRTILISFMLPFYKQFCPLHMIYILRTGRHLFGMDVLSSVLAAAAGRAR